LSSPDSTDIPLRTDDFFRQLADGAPVMIWMSGLDMGCFYFNRAWLDFRGRTLEQEFGNGWAEGVHAEDFQRCVNHYVGCFERRIAFAMSYRLQNAAGKFRWILDRGAPHHLPDGTFLGFFGGCAEIEEASAIDRNVELGPSLIAMRDFARQLATADAVLPRDGFRTKHELESLARLTENERAIRAERRRHAATEMKELANDMIAYGRIPNGVCIP
jgi:PAS domain S-box-containing protein